jgi:hypothetical protein
LRRLLTLLLPGLLLPGLLLQAVGRPSAILLLLLPLLLLRPIVATA